MLSFNNVTKNYRLDRDIIITPVNNVNIQIERGEFIVIIGRSGTGKTTLLNLAAGLVKPSSGRVTIDNQDLGRLNDKQLSLLRSREIGFVFQFPSLLPSLNILDNVSLPAIFTGGKDEKDANSRAAHILDKLGLAEKLNVYPGQLSAGEQKRVVIARSLINGPQLILADEPTSDLDSRTETEVMNIFREINSRGITFLIVTHNLDLVNFATRAFDMQNGKMKEIVNTGVVI